MSVMCQGCGTELATWTGKCPSCGASTHVQIRERTDTFVGKVIGSKYRVLKKLGQGGMGTVYLAEHTGVGQRVAVKFLNQAFSGDPEIVRRFLNEAKSYGQLTHPHAVHLHDFGQDEDGNLFISMEYIEGADLKKTLEEKKRLRLKDTIDVVLQVSEVLAHAHGKGIIHRDMKPENIMLVPGRRGFHAKVLDFGVARLMEEQGTRLTVAGSICGTPRYMSPEQAQGTDVDLRTDIYALGLVLFECVTGASPFPGASIAEVLRKQVTEPTPHLLEFDPQIKVPERLDAVIQQATAKNREERFASMNDFATALTDAVPSDSSLDAYDSENDPGLADAQTIVRAEALPLEKTAHRASPYGRGGEVAAPPRKNLARAIGLGAGAAALLGAGFLAFSGGKPADAVSQPDPFAARGGPAPTLPPPDYEKPPPTRDENTVAVPPVVVVEPPRSDLGAVRVMADTGIFTQAQNEFLAGRLETAEKMLQSLAADSPLKDQASGLRAKVAEVNGLMQRAGAAYQRGQCAQAIKVYQEVLKKSSGMQAAAAGISRCKQQMPAAVLE